MALLRDSASTIPKTTLVFPRPDLTFTIKLDSDFQCVASDIEGPIIDEILMSNLEKPYPLNEIEVLPEAGTKYCDAFITFQDRVLEIFVLLYKYKLLPNVMIKTPRADSGYLLIVLVSRLLSESQEVNSQLVPERRTIGLGKETPKLPP
jgi:hypothetical protein